MTALLPGSLRQGQGLNGGRRRIFLHLNLGSITFCRLPTKCPCSAHTNWKSWIGLIYQKKSWSASTKG